MSSFTTHTASHGVAFEHAGGTLGEVVVSVQGGAVSPRDLLQRFVGSPRGSWAAVILENEIPENVHVAIAARDASFSAVRKRPARR